MTTAAVDVNEAFAAERTAQIQAIYDGRANAIEAAEKLRASTAERIAKGQLVPIGGNAYRVVGGWDNGETWRMQQPKGLDKPLLLPQSGLDMSTGKAALYTLRPEWHAAGTVIPEGITDLSDVLEAGGISWLVQQAPATFTIPGAGEQTVPDWFVNYRDDTRAPLGIVGKVYTPIQNYDAGRFLQDLVEKYNVTFESAGATYGGKHVFIGMKLPEDIMLDLGDGVTDPVRQYLYWRGSHDGWSSNYITVSPWRIACANTERFNLRDAVASWRTRHTTNAMSDERIAEARRHLGLTLKYFGSFKAEEEALARTSLAIAEFEATLKDLFPEPDENASDRKWKNYDAKTGTLTAMYKAQAELTGKTAYSAERTITDWLDHVAPKRAAKDGGMAAARATALIEGDHDDLKNKAHARLMTLANR